MIRRSLTICLGILIASGGVIAAVPSIFDQDTVVRPRRVQSPMTSFLGVELSEVTTDSVQRLKLREERGALIEGITEGSSAAQAGLLKNDVIVKWDGEPIESARELSRHIRETPAGRQIRLGVIRDGREIEVNVKLGERAALARPVRVARPAVAARSLVPRIRPEIQARPRITAGGHLGVGLQSMTPQLAEYFGLAKRSGALVIFVFADSPAAKAGFKAGDVILSAGGETVENPSDLRRVLVDKPEGAIEFRIVRDKQEQTLTVKVEKGTRSWLLEPDEDAGAVVLSQLAPMEIAIPSVKISPVAIALPKLDLPSISIQVPKITMVPVAIPSIRTDLAPMKVQIPKITMTPIAVPSVKLTPMKVEIPKIKIAPIKILEVTRRIVL